MEENIETKNVIKPRKEYPKGTKRPNRSSKYDSKEERTKHYQQVRKEKYAAKVVEKYFMTMINSKNQETKEELKKLIDHLNFVYDNHIDLPLTIQL